MANEYTDEKGYTRAPLFIPSRRYFHFYRRSDVTFQNINLPLDFIGFILIIKFVYQMDWYNLIKIATKFKLNVVNVRLDLTHLN